MTAINKLIKPLIVVTVIAVILSSLLLFTSLDNRVFDLLLHILPPLTEHEKVYVLTLDNDSVNQAGGTPFRREVMGNVVILLRELGVKTIALNLNYPDESPPQVDPVYAASVLDRSLNSGFDLLNKAAVSVIDEIDHAPKAEEREFYKKDILNLQSQVREELEETFSQLLSDSDEYFGQALAFSGCSWLPMTVIQDGDSSGSFARNEESSKPFAEFVAPERAIDMGDKKTPQITGFIPATRKLASRTKGSGFSGVNLDSDGRQRRIHLLLRYNDSYYPQLILAALKGKLGYTSVLVSNKAITLMKSNSELRIPRAQDGSMLLRWPNNTADNTQSISLAQLVYHTMIEQHFILNITAMNDSGFFEFWNNGPSPWEYYLEAERIKNTAFANNREAEHSWLNARHNFFQACETFFNGPFEQAIIDETGGNEKMALAVSELFGQCRLQFYRMADIRREAAKLQDSICIISSDASLMTDNNMMKFRANYSNADAQAVAANMILSGEFLKDSPRYIPILIALLCSLLVGFLISYLRAPASVITGILSIILLAGAITAVFRFGGIYLGMAVPLAALVITFISMLAVKFIIDSNETAILHDTISRNLAPEVIMDDTPEIIMDDSPVKTDNHNLSAEKREMSVIFTNIQRFTSILAKHDPMLIVKLLNYYLTEMSGIIRKNAGSIGRYDRDAILAFVGAPNFCFDHATFACRIAMAMKAAEAELNIAIMEQNLSPIPVFARIGINTGQMIVGNMGAMSKIEYTVMGGAVDLAALLERANRQYRTHGVLISEFTKKRIGNEFITRRLDRIHARGFDEPVRMYELLGADNEQLLGCKEPKALNTWEKAIDLYEERRFKEAGGLFSAIKKFDQHDETAKLYTDRCIHYINSPPPDHWDAVATLA